MMARKSIACLLIYCFITHSHFSQTHGSAKERTKFVIDSTYNKLLKQAQVKGASIAIIDNGEVVYSTGYGFSDVENAVTANDKTNYRIGSITKSFTALSIMQLQEKGQVDVNASLMKYLPELKMRSRFDDNNPLYIKDILTHTSGLPCDIVNGFFCDAPPSIKWEINELNKQYTISPRRYKHAYSNLGFGLLGEVIERQSKFSYNDYVVQNVFKPLNMTTSFINLDNVKAQTFSKGYYHSKPIPEPSIRDQAAGMIHSNVLDMANYIKMYLGKGRFNTNQIVSSASIEEMTKFQISDVILNNNKLEGFGLYASRRRLNFKTDSSIVTILGHAGDTWTYHADFCFIPELNVGAVILTNSENGTAMNSASKLLKTYLLYERQEKLDLVKTIEPDNNSNAAEQYSSEQEIKGKYNFGNLIMDVTNPNKIKFKQSIATIVATPIKKHPNHYALKARLLGFIPFKLRNEEITFVKLNNINYVKSYNSKTKKQDYIAVKSEPKTIPSTWKAAYGSYIVTNNFACANCPLMDMDQLKMTLSSDKGYVTARIVGKTSDSKSLMYLNIVDDKSAVSGGIGRGTGETIQLLDGGNIYYSGFECKKIK
jgi:CubicO group peptidase (beta-lactamase class C family)